MSAAACPVPSTFAFEADDEITVVRRSPVARPTVDLEPLIDIVHRIASVLLHRVPTNVTRKELIVTGMIALVETVQTHADLVGKPQLEWHARVRIRGAMLDHLRSV